MTLVGLALAWPTTAAARDDASSAVDRDRDGVSDAVERQLGLDPDVVGVPEPLNFDMVRGLGARRGEVEMSVLAQHDGALPRGLGGGFELEYAFARGHAVEVELPLSSAGVGAWKGGLQGTLPFARGAPVLHGWLVTGEYLLGDPGLRLTGVYVAAMRLHRRWSAVAMIGGRSSASRDDGARHGGVLNPSLFYDASSFVTVGLETNTLLEVDGTTDLVLMPQVHWQPARAWKVQLGSGAHVDEAGATLLSALRLSYMY